MGIFVCVSVSSVRAQHESPWLVRVCEFVCTWVSVPRVYVCV